LARAFHPTIIFSFFHSPDTEKVYGDAFFANLDGVANALDNVEARHLQLCFHSWSLCRALPTIIFACIAFLSLLRRDQLFLAHDGEFSQPHSPYTRGKGQLNLHVRGTSRN
jgi:hypothetical protein